MDKYNDQPIFEPLYEYALIQKPDLKFIWNFCQPELIKGNLGCCSYVKEKDIWVIAINSQQNIEQATDILAHELAHCIVGNEKEDEHGDEWRRIYDGFYPYWQEKMTAYLNQRKKQV